MDKFWTFEQSLYIVEFTNVYRASSFVWLLVELHINACITYQVKIIIMRSGPSSGSIKNTYCILKPFTHNFSVMTWHHVLLFPMTVWNLKTKVRLGCRFITCRFHYNLTHAKTSTMFLQCWVHLLFDLVQWRPWYKSLFMDFIMHFFLYCTQIGSNTSKPFLGIPTVKEQILICFKWFLVGMEQKGNSTNFYNGFLCMQVFFLA